jgi:hypothetical protein
MDDKPVIKTQPAGANSPGVWLLIGATVIAGVAITLYTDKQSKQQMVKKLFLKLEDELENKFPRGTEFILLESKDKRVMKTDDFSVQCLIIPPKETTNNSLGARLLVIDNFTRSFGCDISYHKVFFNPINTSNLQLDLTRYNNVYPKEELFQEIRKDNRYTMSTQLLGVTKREDVNWFVQFQLDDDEYNKRYEADRQKAAIDTIALEVERLIKKVENNIAMNGDGQSTEQFKAIENPYTRRGKSHGKKKTVAKKRSVTQRFSKRYV